MPVAGQGNYILDAISAGHLVEWEQITNNPTPSFDYSGGVGTGFTVIKFPANSVTLLIASFELDGDPATQALASTFSFQNSAGSPVARTSSFASAFTSAAGDTTAVKMNASLAYMFDSTWDNTGLSLLATLGTGVTMAKAQLSLLSLLL